MLRLHIDPDCDRCQELRDKLEGNRLACEVTAESDGDGSYMVDSDGERIEGHNAIEVRIDELADQLELSRRYQSDVCHDYGESGGTYLEQ
jgi:hypothetical protein